MGSYQSKSPNHEESEDVFCNADPDKQHYFEGDPRSPSIDISRTPLQNQEVKTKPITKNVDLTKECFDKFEEITMNPAIKALMSQIDPRSPTLDFQRTPLAFMMKNPDVVLAHNELNSSHFLNESDLQSNDTLNNSSIGTKCILEPKNLCEELCNSSLQIENIPELETDAELKSTLTEMNSEVIMTPDSQDEIKPVYGLLETNLDYLETDLDTVRRKRKVFINKQNNISSDKPKIESPVTQVDNIINKDLSEDDPRSPSVGIDRTPILVTENVTQTKVGKSSKKANSQMKEVFRNNVKLQQKLSDEKLQEKDSIKKVTDSLLIYEDKFDDNDNTNNLSKKNSNIITTEGARTPLACMINIDKTRPSSKQNTPSNENGFDMHVKINKSSNVQSKIPVRVSKVSPPQYIKSSDIKTIKSRRIVPLDSENTPPQPRKACWDTDNSVVL